MMADGLIKRANLNTETDRGDEKRQWKMTINKPRRL
jgi:hypothetical protein